MKALMMVALATALGACEATTSYDQTTTTSARVEARRPEYVPPSPSNSYTPVVPESVNPPPGARVVQNVTPTAEERDAKIRDDLRKAIQRDDIEVRVKDRKVVLRGKVHTERERMDIDSKARAQDGVIEVDDQIQLVP